MINSFGQRLTYRETSPSIVMLILGVCLSGSCLAIAATSGIGGGLLLVPINEYILGLMQQETVAVSNATLLGGAISNFFANMRKQRKNGRPIIDWNIILVLEPVAMVGAKLGSLLNILLPNWIPKILLTALTAYMSWNTFKRFLDDYRKESRIRKIVQNGLVHIEQQGLNKSISMLTHANSTDFALGWPHFNDAQTDFIGKLNRNLPGEKIIVISLSLKLLVLFEVLSKLVKCGSNLYLLLMGAPMILIIMPFFVKIMLIGEKDQHNKLEIEFEVGDIDWDPCKIILFSTLSSLAGVMAGMFGIGGSFVNQLLLLQVAFVPTIICAASCSTMILFTAAAACIDYISFEFLPWKLGTLMICIGLLFTLIGQIGIEWVIEKFERPSLIILSMNIVITISWIVHLIVSSKLLYDLIQEPINIWKFGKLCRH